MKHRIMEWPGYDNNTFAMQLPLVFDQQNTSINTNA